MFTFLHLSTKGKSSSSFKFISKAPMDIKAFTEPPYPKASSAIFPFCLKIFELVIIANEYEKT